MALLLVGAAGQRGHGSQHFDQPGEDRERTLLAAVLGRVPRPYEIAVLRRPSLL